MSCIETVSKLSLKKNFRTFHHEKAKRVGDQDFEAKQKLLTIDQINKCSFIFQHSRPIECAQHNISRVLLCPHKLCIVRSTCK